jgi:uncharacterized membrane protein
LCVLSVLSVLHLSPFYSFLLVAGQPGQHLEQRHEIFPAQQHVFVEGERLASPCCIMPPRARAARMRPDNQIAS